jgi:hypothetical protein
LAARKWRPDLGVGVVRGAWQSTDIEQVGGGGGRGEVCPTSGSGVVGHRRSRGGRQAVSGAGEGDIAEEVMHDEVDSKRRRRR